MRTQRFAPQLAAAALLASICGWPAEAGTQGTSVSGIAKGILMQPEPQYGTGFAGANLFALGAGPDFIFRATLTEIVSPCMSCREGDLDGMLDDGVGLGPDYFVKGHWTANQVSGLGSFESLLYKASAPLGPPVGKLEAGFNDPPLPPGFAGPLSGTWTLRR